MKVVVCHNFYAQPGGEDQSFQDEVQLLESHGHQVRTIVVHNRELKSGGWWNAVRGSLFNTEVARHIRDTLRQFKPDLMHCHNTFPQISDGAYRVARQCGVPVIQTLRNFRWVCPAASLLRDGQPCRLCLNRRIQWPAVKFGCYNDSRTRTAVIAWRNFWQRNRRSGVHGVDQFIALTQMAKEIYVAAGFPAERIAVKPNFVAADPGFGPHDGGFALYAGRLTVEKGVHVLLDAWRDRCGSIPLRIIGDGPMRDRVVQAAKNSNIHWLGEVPHSLVMENLKQARLLIMPSVGQETFGRTLIEAFATGTPVVSSNHGSMAEIVTDEETGLLFQTANAEHLAQQVQRLWSDDSSWQQMARRCRMTYETRYSASGNYQQLLSIYRQVMWLQ